MDISELRVIYSPQHEGTNNLIKRWFSRAEQDGLLGVGARTNAIKIASAGTQ